MTLNPSSLTDPLEGDPWGSGRPRTFAASLARFETLAPHTPEETQLLAAAHALRRDTQRYGADFERLHSTWPTSQSSRGRCARSVRSRRSATSERPRSEETRRWSSGSAASAPSLPGVSRGRPHGSHARRPLELGRKLASELPRYSAEAAKLADDDLARWRAKVESDAAARKSSPQSSK